MQRLDRFGRGRSKFVELEQARNDRIFVVLADFGADNSSPFGGTPGPLHNEIAQPDRTQDNVTIWQPDYNRRHYERMYFTRMLEYYRLQSSGRYGFTGGVVDWVTVRYNEARYGTNACGSNVCSSVWALIRDAITIWTADQLAAGKTAAEVKADARHLRRLGPLRLRRRRQLRRARRLHRPLPDRPRRPGRRDRRRRAGRRCDLEPPLVRLLQPGRRRRTGVQPERRHPVRDDRHVGGRLHDAARERRPRRVRPRIRPRPRPARQLRHLGRRQRDRLLGPDVGRVVPRPRRRRPSAPGPAT